MSLELDDDAKIPLRWTAAFDSDPASATAVLEVTLAGAQVAGSPFAMTWQGAAVAGTGTWTRVAQTDALFCGSSTTTSGSDVKLAAGTYVAEPRATFGSQVIVGPRTLLVVR